MKIDLILAVLQNLKCIAEIGLITVVSIGGFAAFVGWLGNVAGSKEEAEKSKAILNTIKKVLPYLIPFALLAIVPSIDDIWKVRIGLIKLELSSPENIAKGTEEIARIAKKLECEYLGCKEEKK